MIADKEEYSRRLSICEKCDRKNIINICKECGCIVIAKAKLIDSKCPLDKWVKNEKDIK